MDDMSSIHGGGESRGGGGVSRGGGGVSRGGGGGVSGGGGGGGVRGEVEEAGVEEEARVEVEEVGGVGVVV